MAPASASQGLACCTVALGCLAGLAGPLAGCGGGSGCTLTAQLGVGACGRGQTACGMVARRNGSLLPSMGLLCSGTLRRAWAGGEGCAAGGLGSPSAAALPAKPHWHMNAGPTWAGLPPRSRAELATAGHGARASQWAGAHQGRLLPQLLGECHHWTQSGPDACCLHLCNASFRH